MAGSSNNFKTTINRNVAADRQQYRNFNDLFTDDDIDDMEISDEVLLAACKNSQSSNRNKSVDEHVLSQKISQLSTSSKNQQKQQLNKTISKKVQLNDLEKIPEYLAKNNKSFENMLTALLVRNKTLTNEISSSQLENFRIVAILIHRLKFIQILHGLWTIYLQAGLGQLKSHYSQNELGQQLWVKPIQSMVKINVRSGIEHNEACLTYVKNRLTELDKAKQECHADLQTKINFSSHYSTTIRQAIEKFVEENLMSLRKKIEHKIQLVHYSYDEQILKDNYLKQNPNETQIQIAEELYTAKQQQELSKYTCELLNQQLIHYNASTTFDQLPIAHVPLFDSICNINMQQDLYAQYRNIIEQTKTDMLTLYSQSAVDQKIRYQKQYNDTMEKIQKEQCLLPDEQKLIRKMLELIEQRAHIIEERFKCIHQFKVHNLSIQS
ncbi:unnamed protein product [Rotaria magnacalcarata]|uniref:Uncharacterized protein n=6 Tax=Rotaria magnacalcarata TaxID=392030 RepID=A0A816NDB7_9BILA|nr:unnamed protein product [Rotaria magnacalcarata]CAF1960098.1 unnamed protein product [Rotaria magnacalcarata]CAF2031677.1 unnamed protein product [Rotaria magnacalcarata]CAF2150309.1 unnamed protein product [Rotaria magnacalcarata]CAF4081103.1 unnamed protein product [Rotaria magnacalcarata]